MQRAIGTARAVSEVAARYLTTMACTQPPLYIPDHCCPANSREHGFGTAYRDPRQQGCWRGTTGMYSRCAAKGRPDSYPARGSDASSLPVVSAPPRGEATTSGYGAYNCPAGKRSSTDSPARHAGRHTRSDQLSGFSAANRARRASPSPRGQKPLFFPAENCPAPGRGGASLPAPGDGRESGLFPLPFRRPE